MQGGKADRRCSSQLLLRCDPRARREQSQEEGVFGGSRFRGLSPWTPLQAGIMAEEGGTEK